MSNTAIGEVRFSFVHVFQPYAPMQGDDPKYSITVLIPKNNPTLVQQIGSAIEAAKQDGVSKKWGGTMPSVIASPIYDGDGARPNGQPFGPECSGHYVMTARCNPDYPPEVVVGQDRHPATNQNEVYSGAYGYVSVQFFAYNTKKNGIGCGLCNVWKTRDGEPLSGRTTADDDFGGIQIASTSGLAQATPQPAAVPAYATPQAAPQPVYPDISKILGL